MQKKISIPEDGIWILQRLQSHGYTAYAVGGCIRDMLLHKQPHDWDFCTNATPEQIQMCFLDVPCLTMGIQHGTISVLRNKTIYEITTFRKESTYQDHRHPDAVQFTTSLYIDLQRRDFTINAMAYHPKTGLVDPFHGAADLQKKILRCVGNPTKRFGEDALRILRAIRFSAVYGLTILPETAEAMQKTMHLLQFVSAERILSECEKIVTAPYATTILTKHADIWFSIFPELRKMHGFLQHHPRHYQDVWQHSLTVLSHCNTSDSVLCWAALLHDSGKPECFIQDETGIGHFYGHSASSARKAEQICRRLKMEKKKTTAIVELVAGHEIQILPRRTYLLRLLGKYGAEQTKRLLSLRTADLQAQVFSYAASDLQKIQQMKSLLEDILQENACFQIKDLEIHGKDLLELGIPQGVEIGTLLKAALEQVVSGILPNEKASLLQWIQQTRNNKPSI